MSKGIAVIKEGIREKAAAEVGRILIAGEEEAKRIMSDAEKEVEEATLRAVKPEVLIMKRRITGSAMIEGRRAVLEARAQAMSKVIQAVEERLANLSHRGSHRYADVLFDLIKEAAIKIGEDRLVLAGNERDIEYLRKIKESVSDNLKKALGGSINVEFADEPYHCIGGVVVSNARKNKFFYNTLEGRLLKISDELKQEISHILFGG